MSVVPDEQPEFERFKYRRTKLCDLGLTIEGTPLAPIVEEFLREVRERNIRVTPHCYLSTEWGVPFPSISIGIPFYLAHPDLIELHGERTGHVEGVGRADILRYLRHEMGHVVNYAWRLYEDEDWVKTFGSMTQPYLEDYRPSPFSRRYVRHLPGWYAQKHPDEDWAETFAVWMAPGDRWREEYRTWPAALAKLKLCDRLMATLSTREPVVTDEDPDEHVATLPYTAEDFYKEELAEEAEFPQGLDGSIRSIFEDLNQPEHASTAPRLPAASLIRRHRSQLAADVFRWTGHFPERTNALLRHLAERAEALEQVYPEDRDTEAAIALTTLITALAMNHVHQGTYLP
ncbi:MAG: putative zinc-binding metallopeptidase [Planctomycetota bacterium]|nr:putative zinc-binding metallopeptidase [Planctomycetota bacterium]